MAGGCTLAASEQELASTKHWRVARITDGVYVCIMTEPYAHSEQWILS